ncbi:MAG: hydrogenase maturation nickel metallochaperone HypA [Halobacterium sp.]
MHELSVARGVVDRAAETAREHGADSVDAVTLAVGRVTHLNPDQLRFCVQTVAAGTPVEDATVRVERVDPRARCDCGWTGEPDAVDDAAAYVPDPVCPSCGDRVELTRGRGCRVRAVEIPETETTQADDRQTRGGTRE